MNSEAQRERRQRGEDFQDELRRGWRRLPQCCRLRITDGVNRTGSRPADEVILLPDLNLMVEAKRTAGDRFELSMLRPNQQKGLLDFDLALSRNRALILVSFLSGDLDEAYAFRLSDGLVFMRNTRLRYIPLEAFRQPKLKTQLLPLVPGTEQRTYNLEGVETCFK